MHPTCKSAARRARLASVVCAAAAVAGLTRHADGTTHTWSGAAGASWSLPTNWSPSGQPSFGDVVLINTTNSCIYDTAVTGASLAALSIDASGGAVLSVSAGNPNISGGTINIGSVYQGTYNASAGVLSGTITLGATNSGIGTINLLTSTASIAASSVLCVGSFGTGMVNQNGGSATITSGSLEIGFGSGGNGTYQFNSGTINSLISDVGDLGSGTLSQLSGTHSTGTLELGTNAGGNGFYHLGGGTVSASTMVVVGGIGSGAFEQASGVLSTGTLMLAKSAGGTGTFSLNNGTVSATLAEVIGSDAGASGVFTQVGGTNTTPTLNIATFSSAARGAYNLNGGTLNCGTGESIGAFGSGSFNQTAGVNNANSVSIGTGGVYNLSAGTLVVGSGVVSVNSTGAFNFTGGAIKYNSGTFSVDTAGPVGTSLNLNAGMRIDTPAASVGSTSFVYLTGGTLNATGTLNNAGEIRLASQLGQINGGILANSGLISGTGHINSVLANGTAGEVRVEPADDLRFAGTGNANLGRLTLGGGVMEFTHDLQNGTLGTVAGRGTLIGTGGITNNGTMTFSAGLSDVFGAITNTTVGPTGASGKIIVTGGSTVTFYNNVSNAGAAELRVSAGSRAVFLGTVTVSGTSHLTGTGTTDMEALQNLPGPIIAGGDAIVGPSGSVSTPLIEENSLDVEGAATISVDPNDAHTTSRVGALTIGGSTNFWSGKLDLSGNNLIVDYTGATPVSTIANQVKNGFNGGAWNGAGINSSSAQSVAADTNNNHKTAVGYAEASSIGLGSFDGQGLDGSAVVLKYTYTGDATLDGKVDSSDFTALSSHFGSTNQYWYQGDFNYDGVVNALDFNAIATNFGQPTIAAPALGSLVPEPTTMALAASFITLCTARRRRSTGKSE